MQGKFITFEGIDGCGKTTQAQNLRDNLSTVGIKSLITREPGGSPGAEEIRKLLVTGEQNRWSPETEILLFTAARKDHLEKTILPAVKSGSTVICDRFFDSTRVYQTVNKSKLTTFVEQLHELVIGFKPDLTFLIDMEPSVALARGLARNSNEDRFEGLGLAFQEKVRRGFIKFANIEKERYIIIDGDDSEEAISNQVFTKYKRFFKE